MLSLGHWVIYFYSSVSAGFTPGPDLGLRSTAAKGQETRRRDRVQHVVRKNRGRGTILPTEPVKFCELHRETGSNMSSQRLINIRTMIQEQLRLLVVPDTVRGLLKIGPTRHEAQKQEQHKLLKTRPEREREAEEGSILPQGQHCILKGSLCVCVCVAEY